VYCDAPRRAALWALDLAGVDPRSHLQSELQDGRLDREASADRPRRTIEDGEEAVACGVDLLTLEPGQLTPHDRVV